MCVTFYTVDDLRPGRCTGWNIRRFQTLKDAISHYRTLPSEGTRILGMADEGRAWELIRCVRLFPGEAQGEDVLAADYRSCGLTRELPELKKALDTCVDELRPRYMLEPERMVPIPTGKKLREELRDKLLWRGHGGKYDSAIRSMYVYGVGWVSPQDVKKQGPLPLVLCYKVDAMTKEGAYLSLEPEPWEYQLMLTYTKRYYEDENRRNMK